MLEVLFGSKTRVSVLTLFFFNPGKKFYVREVVRKTNNGYMSVNTELRKLETFGLLKSELSGNQKYFWIDENFFIYGDLQKLIIKTEGVVYHLKEKLANLRGIDFLFVYGSFAKNSADPQSDIDLFIVGDVNENDLINIISENEAKIGRPINYTIYKRDDLIQRIQNQNPFILNVMNDPKIMLIGNENEFTSLGRTETD